MKGTNGIPRAARIRAYLVGGVVTLGLTGVAWRAWALQVGDNAHYRELAERQHEAEVDIPAPRGDVIDAKGRPLAVSADADSIWADPHAIHDVSETADALAKVLGVEPGALEAKLAGDHKFVWIARHVAPDVAKRVRDAKLAGIEVVKEPRRWYPAREVGGTVIGSADIDGNGVEGIEKALNAELTGHRGAGTAVRDAHGKRMFADGLEAPQPGATVQLTLDRSIQAIAERALTATVTEKKAKSGAAVVIEIGTGRVLALASYPTYDPNAAAPGQVARNHAVNDVYEPGSVMKMFSIAAALDDGLVTLDTELDLNGGSLTLPGTKHTIRDVDSDKSLTVKNIIKRSSNVGAAKIALRFGREKLYAGLIRYGFGKKTGIELIGERTGSIRPGNTWRDIELATIAYGYGITVTPLQIAAALAAIGDGGIYHAPYIVERVTDPDGTVLQQGGGEGHAVMKPSTAAAMREALASVFESGKLRGTAGGLVVPGFRCGGKTGTANKYDKDLHGYNPDHYLSSFAGLAPIDHPRLAIVVLVDDPDRADHFGAKVGGPAFAAIASESLRYLGVPGTNPVCEPKKGPPLNPNDVWPAKTCLPADASAQTAAAAEVVEPLSADPIDAADAATVTVPDFRGMGVAKAIDAAKAAHVAIHVSGTGRVVTQDPTPGPAHDAGTVNLRFSDER
ncbi:MAG TPA: penicillin-binding transpeptidase domain-containing protein [Kofleriaceae bacterium]